jgi:hypothetical protein
MVHTATRNKARETINKSCGIIMGKIIFSVELIESPRVHMSSAPSTHITVRQGESLTLECNAVGVPAPIIYWKKDGHRVRQSHGDNESNLFEKITNIGSTTVESTSTVGRLHLDCVQPSMAGVYECVADNGFKKAINHTRVTVVSRKSLQILSENISQPFLEHSKHFKVLGV